MTEHTIEPTEEEVRVLDEELSDEALDRDDSFSKVCAVPRCLQAARRAP
jgi:hypothetical protein